MTTRIVFTENAEEHATTINEWWMENRPDSPELFADELGQILDLLSSAPEVGTRFNHPSVRGVRRVLLKRSRYHVYYVADAEDVLVLAVWGAVRGSGPDLKPPK